MRADLVAVSLAAVACGRVDFDPGMIDAMVDAAPTCAASFVAVPPAPLRYQLVTAPVPWAEARAACEAFGVGHGLALPTTDAERIAISEAAEALAPGRWWIGGTDVTTEGTFLDVAGVPIIYLPWGEFEPNNNGDEDCLDIMANVAEGSRRETFFDDLSCAGSHTYICACTLP